MVATTDRYASEVGIEVLRSGGNAVDAAVAVAFALAVVNPEAGNIGGGGFLLARGPDGRTSVLDFRTAAPAAATRETFLRADPDAKGSSVTGHLAAAVPGSVRGLWDGHRRLGSVPWADLVDPAVSLAAGFVVEDRFVTSFTRRVVEGLRRFPASAAVFLPGEGGSGEEGPSPPASGDVFRQPELARTLERIRDRGPDGFYAGETAELIAAEMERGGGIVTTEDLASYEAVWRRPIRCSYRGRVVLTVPPPSSGGAVLVGTANILNAFSLSELPLRGARHLHVLAEAWRRAHEDANRYVADPDSMDVPAAEFTSPEHGARRAREIEHTTHVSIVDSAGGAVALTTTINTWYGSKVVVEGAGFLLNGDMDDFTTAPGRPNHFGLVQGDANAIAPGKRMASTMTPTIVLGPGGAGGPDRLLLVVGTPGGATIPTTVFQVVSGVIDHELSLAEAVEAPRIHHQHLPDLIRYEPDGLPRSVVEDLRALGHEVVEGDEPWGDVQAVLARPGGSLQGASDRRRGGTVLAL